MVKNWSRLRVRVARPFVIKESGVAALPSVPLSDISETAAALTAVPVPWAMEPLACSMTRPVELMVAPTEGLATAIVPVLCATKLAALPPLAPVTLPIVRLPALYRLMAPFAPRLAVPMRLLAPPSEIVPAAPVAVAFRTLARIGALC